MLAFERGSLKSWIAVSCGVACLVIVAKAIVTGSITVGSKFRVGPLTFKRSEDPVGFWGMTLTMALCGLAAFLFSGFLG
jgi:hypothetical protein